MTILQFKTPSLNPLKLKIQTLETHPSLNSQNSPKLILTTDLNTYQQLDQTASLNLKPEAKIAADKIDLLPDQTITIQTIPHPKLLPDLEKHLPNIDQTLALLQYLNSTQPDHRLFQTENWFATEISQTQPTGTIGYRTFWHYISPDLLSQENPSQADISAALLQYFQDWSNNTLPGLATAATADSAAEINQALEDLAHSQFETLTQTATAELQKAIAQAFQPWLDPDNNNPAPATPAPTTPASTSLLDILTQFFQQDDWPHTLAPDKPVIYTNFQGDNGQWPCHAKAREPQAQVVFYSRCPFKAPEAQRSAIAEFIARANYGMIMGNFELDFNDGEIRYKTSIDVEGDLLTLALVKQLVYTNVLTMDQYLPGLTAIIQSNISPQMALQQVE
jgi:hypothetical protein